MCTCSTESQTYPGLHKQTHSQQVEGGDSPPLLHSGETSPGVLSPGEESPAQERHRSFGVGPEKVTKMIRGLEHLCCDENLRADVAQPEREKAPGRHSCGLRPIKGAYTKDGEGLFTRACSNRTSSNDFRLKVDRFRLDIKKKLFTTRVVRQQNRLPREAVEVLSLEGVKVGLGGALGNLM